MKQTKQELLEQIEKLKSSDKLIIVEGNKDKKALEKLGITNIATLSKKPLFHITEHIAEDNKEVIILTDLDREGKKLYGRLYSDLQRFGVRIDNSFREFLIKKTKLRQIEGIIKYIETIS